MVEQPEGTTVLEMRFSPSPSPSVTEDMTQQTDDITKPDVEIPTDNDDSEGSDQMQEGQEFTEGLGGENQDGTAVAISNRTPKNWPMPSNKSRRLLISRFRP